MRPSHIAAVALALFVSSASPGEPQPAPKQQDGEIRLLVRADDMGAAQSIDEACIKTSTDGISRSVEVIVPGPWFLDAVRLLKENPKVDVGVHLALTSEWERVKWRPLTHAPSLVDDNGYFYPMTRQRKDFLPHTGFLESKYKLDEVEAELRAQIEMATKNLPGRVTHVSYHMYTAFSTPQLRAITVKLAGEFRLKWEEPKGDGRWGATFLSAAQKEQALVKMLEELQPGDWFTVAHPAFDTPEMRNVFHKGNENVAANRAGITAALLSAQVKEVIARRKIKLISYADLAPEPR